MTLHIPSSLETVCSQPRYDAAVQVALVAVHPWDCHGAQQAGLQAAHITRGAPWPTAYYKPPQYSAESLLQVTEMIVKSKE